MARAKTNFFVDELLIERVRQTAERQRWTMADAMELAMELFLSKFEQAPAPGLPTETAPVEVQPVKEII